MAVDEKTKKLVNRMPSPDRKSMFTEDIDKDQIETAVAELYAGGRDQLIELIDMLGQPGSTEDVKPRYAAHCLENYALIMKDEKARRAFSEAVAGELGSDRPAHVKKYLCQLLQWSGRAEAAPALGKILIDEELCEAATMALTAIGTSAVEQFAAALPKATGKCRLNVVQGLGTVGDASAAAALRDALKDPDREVRLAAGWGLARLGDARSADVLLQAADADPGWERIGATKHCLVLAERLAASGDKSQARKIYQHLEKTRTSSAEKHIRESAQRGLAAV